MSKFEDQINQIFPNELFSITIFGRSVSIKPKTRNPEKENTTKICLTFTVEEDNIFISNLEKCGITGSQSLRKVEELATIIPNIKTISLTDASSIEKCGHNINLALLKILTKGESWYNSLGYKSSTYDIEVENNRKYMNMDCKTFFDRVFQKSFEKYMDINSIEAIKARIKQFGSVRSLTQVRLTEQKKLDNPNYIADITREYKLKESELIEAMTPYNSDKTVKEYFENEMRILSCKNAKWLSEIMDYISQSGIIQYDIYLSKLIYREADLTEPIHEEPNEEDIIPEENEMSEGNGIAEGKRKTRRKRRKYASRASRHLSKRAKPKRKYSGTRRR